MALIYFTETWKKKEWKAPKWLHKFCWIIFLVLGIFKSWDDQYKSATTSQKLLEDKSPNLEGFVHRYLIADEPGTTNSVFFLEIGITSSRGIPSIAEEFGLMVMLSKHSSTNAEPIVFSQEYKCNFVLKGNPWLLDLKRPQLISEKTIKAIPVGESRRGRVAFRLPGIPMKQFQPTNIVLSFSDVDGTRICVTNGFWRGVRSHSQTPDDLTAIIPGAENIFYPVEQPVRTEWLPPELPVGCSNVVVFLGSQGLILPRQVAEISSVGKRFSISELPDFLLKDLDKMPNYSPRQRQIWIKAEGSKVNIGGVTVDFPIQPIIISNRLYVEVEIPFSNEKRKLVMSDAFQYELPIPPSWDINFSTNYDAYGNGIYAYEIVNELTNPVLQVTYSAPNEVHVNGIFLADSNTILAAFGEQPQLAKLMIVGLATNQGSMTASLQIQNFRETLIINSNETIASFGHRFTNELFRPIFKYQRPIFKYPSNRNLGAFQTDLLKL